MTELAARNLWQQKFQLVLSVLSVALAIMLIMLLNGFLTGVYRQVTAYLDNTPADYIVAEDGVTNLLSATSVLPGGAEASARGLVGVDQVIPIVSQFVILDIHDKKIVTYLVGYDPELGGGPWSLREGRLPASGDEIVLDWIMAQKHGYSLGDTIEILDKEFSIVGTSNGTNSWMASFMFMQKEAAEKLLRVPGTSSFLLLSLKDDTELGSTVARLRRRLRQYEVIPASTIKQNDVNLIVQVFAIPLRMMVSIAFAVGTAILSMVIYSATAGRMREYGVLKAIGASNRQLYWLVTQQAIVLALLGIVLGIITAWSAAQWIMRVSPTFLIVLHPTTVLWTSVSGLVMGLLAALIPVRQVAGLDPATVFRK